MFACDLYDIAAVLLQLQVREQQKAASLLDWMK